MKDTMCEVTTGLIFGLKDDASVIENNDKDALSKFNDIEWKLNIIRQYAVMMVNETNYDEFKAILKTVDETLSVIKIEHAFVNGYQQAMRDMKEGK